MICNLTMISRLFSLLLILIFSPLFLFVAIIIVVDDGFPILFRQKRIGINNTEFWVFKFRTMRKGTPDIPTHLVDTNEHLYTQHGMLLRKLSIDELPQLINILKGEMVFIGPRPALYNQDDLVALRTNARIHTLMPGITGWAQVNGRDALSIDDKVNMDIFYLKNQSLYIDIKILFLTIVKVFKSEDVSI